jgi:hypothetical protein
MFGNCKYRRLKIAATLGFLILAANPSHAEVNFNGFGDIVGSKSNSDYGVDDIGNAGRAYTFDSESRLGLNLSSSLSDSLDFAGQIVARGSDGGSYSLKADWLFLTYRPNDEIRFRIGRQITPIFLYSEQYDVGYTYIWSRLPYEVYGPMPVKQFTGASVICSKNFGAFQVSGEAFGGGADFEVHSESSVSTPVSTYTAQGNNVKGLVLDVQADDFRFRAAYSGSVHSKLFVTLVSPAYGQTLGISPASPTVTTSYDLGAVDAFTLGASYDTKKLMLIAEGIRISNPNSPLGSSTSLYGTVGYHILPILTPYITYAWQGNISSSLNFYPGTVGSPTPSSYEQEQNAWVGGLNLHASLAAVVKAEFMRTAYRYVNNSLNFRVNTATLTTDFVF